MIKATKVELYPGTAHGLDYREFVSRYKGMLAMFADPDRGARSLYGRFDRMDFSGALLAVKAGHHVSRDGWMGVGYVTLQDGHPDGVAIDAVTAAATGRVEGEIAVVEPCLMLCRSAYTVIGNQPRSGQAYQREHQASLVAFIPAMSDLLAEDWKILIRPDDAAAAAARGVVTEFGAGSKVRW